MGLKYIPFFPTYTDQKLVCPVAVNTLRLQMGGKKQNLFNKCAPLPHSLSL